MINQEDFELIMRVKALYDWSLLADILKGEEYISKGKIALYEQHKKDLKLLKYLVKSYKPDKYDEGFKFSKKNLHNYTAYSGNFKSSCNDPKEDKLSLTKTTNKLYYLKKIFKDISVKKEDNEQYDDFKDLK